MLNPAEDVSQLNDEEVVRLTELEMEAQMSDQMAQLIERQKNGELLFDEHYQLQALLQIYQLGTLLKARALSEAVKRGLRPPLEP